jgi:hypothetical protein
MRGELGRGEHGLDGANSSKNNALCQDKKRSIICLKIVHQVCMSLMTYLSFSKADVRLVREAEGFTYPRLRSLPHAPDEKSVLLRQAQQHREPARCDASAASRRSDDRPPTADDRRAGGLPSSVVRRQSPDSVARCGQSKRCHRAGRCTASVSDAYLCSCSSRQISWCHAKT